MTEPKGFPANADMKVESDRASQVNPGRVSINRSFSGVIMYRLSEWYANNKNGSIESVGYSQGKVSRTGEVGTVATIGSRGPLSESELGGVADGQVYLQNALGVFDVTQVAARVGVTAKDIRKLQYDVAFDGKIDAAEQQQIKNLIGRVTKAVFQER